MKVPQVLRLTNFISLVLHIYRQFCVKCFCKNTFEDISKYRVLVYITKLEKNNFITERYSVNLF